ncbi:MAG TPA: hypothetical protein VNL18_16545 [Gemmatimonadales bacterium]|nr:hypothetical protein [Gemmatimonadales bacterium]
MTMGLRVLGGGLTVLSLAGLGALSRAPYPSSPPAHAVIRLTWRASGARVTECRRLAPEELARRPAHMRREEICEGRALPYRLVVVLDRDTVADEAVEPRGARADRPLYVFHELPVEPGERQLEVAFVRKGGDEPRDGRRTAATTAGDERREGGEDEAPVREGHAGRAQETPVVLRFGGRVRLEPRQVAVITYDPERRTLVLKGYGQTP